MWMVYEGENALLLFVKFWVMFHLPTIHKADGRHQSVIQVNLDMTDGTVPQIFAYDGRCPWSQSDAYQVFVICIRQILHMTDQFSWSHWVRHIQVHLYLICEDPGGRNIAKIIMFPFGAGKFMKFFFIINISILS